ncbi:DUF1430 domain-containing protein [Brochothrix thermosphacta]|uniref:DUF1430 domain-containing protein n=1 Tax=Brochothrix thermosphacta TaxID=2756 RepID=UPI0039B00FB6
MKKIIFVVLTLQMVLLSVLLVTLEKRQSRQQLLYNDVTMMSIDTDGAKGDVATKIIDSANKLDLTIAVYIHPDEKTQKIVTNDVSLGGRIPINDVKLTKPTDFISSQKTIESQQKGQFALFDQTLRLDISLMKDNRNYQPSSLYYLFTTNKKTLDQFKTVLTKEGMSVNEGKIDAQAQMWLQHLSQQWDWVLLNLLVSIALCVVLLHDGFLQQRTRYLLSLQGYAKGKIWWYGIKRLRGPLLYSFLVALCFIVVWQFSQSGSVFIDKVLLIVSFTAVLILFSSIVIIGLTVLFDKQALDSVKGKRPVKRLFILYLCLKICFLTLIAGLVHVYVSNQAMLTSALEETADWKKMRGIYTPEQSYVGQENRAISAKSGQKLKKLYEAMQPLGGYLMASNDFKLDDGVDEKAFLAEKDVSLINPDERKVILDLNYLKRHPLKGSIQYEDIVAAVNWDKRVRNVLVPQKFKVREAEIKKIFLEDFVSSRIDVMDYYNDFLDLPRTTEKAADLSVNLIYIDDDNDYFSYGNGIPLLLPNAFATIETGNITPLDYSWYFSGNVYFEAKGDPYATIFPAIQKSKTEGLVRSVASVYNRKGFIIQLLNENKAKLALFLGLLIGSSLLLTYTLTALYFRRYQRRIVIMYCHGYNYWKMHYPFLRLLIILNGLLFAVLLLTTKMVIIGSFLCYVTLEFALVYGFHRLFEKRQLAKSLKRGS